jgi:predicted nucleic acid-binding protein
LAGYFFDSSALVKLYHPELGTPVVDRIVNFHVNVVRLSRLSVAEMISAFAIKARMKSITREDARALVRRFRGDLTRGKFEVF